MALSCNKLKLQTKVNLGLHIDLTSARKLPVVLFLEQEVSSLRAQVKRLKHDRIELLDRIRCLEGVNEFNKSGPPAQGLHLPQKHFSISKRRSIFSDCHLCRKNGKRKATQFSCNICGKKLCIDGMSSCFTVYHQQLHKTNQIETPSQVTPAQPNQSSNSLPTPTDSPITSCALNSEDLPKQDEMDQVDSPSVALRRSSRKNRGTSWKYKVEVDEVGYVKDIHRHRDVNKKDAQIKEDFETLNLEENASCSSALTEFIKEESEDIDMNFDEEGCEPEDWFLNLGIDHPPVEVKMKCEADSAEPKAAPTESPLNKTRPRRRVRPSTYVVKPKLQCPNCKRLVCSSRYNFDRHVFACKNSKGAKQRRLLTDKRIRWNRRRKTEPKKPYQVNVRCPKCNDLFATQYHMKLHLLTCRLKEGAKQQKVLKDKRVRIRRPRTEPKKPSQLNVRCPKCNDLFATQYHMKLHLLTCGSKGVKRPPPHPKATHFCSLCDRGYTLKSKLTTHQVKHHNYKPASYHCHICTFKLPNQEDLEAHLKSHENQDPEQFRNFCCSYCPRRFFSQPHLIQHLMAHVNKPYGCHTHCNLRFYTEIELQRHVKRMVEKGEMSETTQIKPSETITKDSSEKLSKYQEFENTMENKEDLSTSTEHTSIPHLGADITNSLNQEASNVEQLDLTHPSFEVPDAVTYIQLNQDGNKIYDIENSTIENVEQGRTTEAITVRGRKSTSALEDSPFKCQFCSKVLKNNASLRQHRQHYHKQFVDNDEIESFKCSSCDRSFVTKMRLDYHERTAHQKVKPFACELCFDLDVRFTAKCSLQRHIQTFHSESETEKFPFNCSSCSRRFRDKFSLQDHERAHTGDFPFACDLCPARFTVHHRLRYHKNDVHFNNKSKTLGKFIVDVNGVGRIAGIDNEMNEADGPSSSAD